MGRRADWPAGPMAWAALCLGLWGCRTLFGDAVTRRIGGLPGGLLP